VKGKHIIGLVLILLIIDQALKFYIKTNYFLGEEHAILGNWGRLHFVENPGMAWGWKFGGEWGKIILTLFRLVAAFVGVWYIAKFVKQQMHWGFLTACALIYAGAVGNLIDSIFYGQIFEASDPYLQNVAKLVPFGAGYAKLLQGHVVDMFYFPLIQIDKLPSWVPFWGGEEFEFFRPVFNFADACISVGVGAMLIWQKKFFPEDKSSSSATNTATD
jgi:signal peptidase II